MSRELAADHLHAADAAPRDPPSDADEHELAVHVPPADVFIIDDDKPLAEVFHQVLERRGLATDTFSGCAQLEATSPDEWADVMILDLSLGESDAVEVIQLLASRSYDGTVALMSGRGEDRLNEVQKIGLRYGLTMLTPLAKPIRSDQIDKLVRYVNSLERHHDAIADSLLHDINNVLATIVLHADLLLEEIGPRGPGRDHVNAMIEAVDRGSALVRDAPGREMPRRHRRPRM